MTLSSFMKDELVNSHQTVILGAKNQLSSEYRKMTALEFHCREVLRTSDFLIPPSTLINPHSIYTAITGRELGHFQRTYVPIRHFRGSVSIVLSTIETKSARCVSCDQTDHTKSELTHVGNISYEISVSDDISPW